jgi:hypothetical protein
MAHFAKLGANGKVIQVLTLNNSDMLNADNQQDEAVGQQYLEQHNNWPAQMWIQTSYNTRGGKHYDADGNESADQSKALRGNYAGIGYTWDEDNEIFWPKKPHASWTKNTTTASWDAPITYPSVTNDGADPVVWNWNITWNETAYQADNTKGWEGTKQNVDGTDHSDTATYDWNGSSWVAQA